MLLVIIAVAIRKCLCKTRVHSSQQYRRDTGRVNDYHEVDLELSNR